MELKELAPWIAIAVTLILSILVPLFTQIANNRFQLKLEMLRKEQAELERASTRKRDAFESFIQNTGGCIGAASKEMLQGAIASINKLYIYAPEEWWRLLDTLCWHIKNYEWEQALPIFQDISKRIAQEIGR